MEDTTIAPATRGLLMTVRQALIMVLGGIEDYLSIPRSIVPRHKRTHSPRGEEDQTRQEVS